MRFLSRIPILLGGLLMAATASACDTHTPEVTVPNVQVPTEEPVTMPVQITARESPPPDMG
jgi:hypothetical protein